MTSTSVTRSKVRTATHLVVNDSHRRAHCTCGKYERLVRVLLSKAYLADNELVSERAAQAVIPQPRCGESCPTRAQRSGFVAEQDSQEKVVVEQDRLHARSGSCWRTSSARDR